MNIFENFSRYLALLLALGLIVAFIAGWRISNNFYELKVQRNSVEQSSAVTLSVVDKISLYESVFIVPTLNYLVLSNGEKIYVSREDYQKYEINQSYEFELLEQIYVTHRIKPYSSNGS